MGIHVYKYHPTGAYYAINRQATYEEERIYDIRFKETFDKFEEAEENYFEVELVDSIEQIEQKEVTK